MMTITSKELDGDFMFGITATGRLFFFKNFCFLQLLGSGECVNRCSSQHAWMKGISVRSLTKVEPTRHVKKKLYATVTFLWIL